MRALVTGGGRGIGADIARVLARDGWEVVVCARSGAQVEAVAAEIGAEWMQVDVSDRASVQRMVTEAGEVDLLVANAGVSEGHAPRPSWEIDLDEWWQVYEVNVLGVHLCCRAVIPGMLERGRGRIVITGSGAAYLPGGKSTVYAPSKAATCRYGEMLANSSRDAFPSFLQPRFGADGADRRRSSRRCAVDAARTRSGARQQALDRRL